MEEGGTSLSHTHPLWPSWPCAASPQIITVFLSEHPLDENPGYATDHHYDVAFDCAGNVYVAEKQIACGVNIFNSEGKHLREFGRMGSSRGDLNFPSALSIDSEDLVYIAEPTYHRVSILTTRGIFLASFG